MKFILVVILISSCKLNSTKSQSKGANSDDFKEESILLDMENEDIELPGPVENLFSLLFGTPVFSNNGVVHETLKYNPKAGLDPVGKAIESLQTRGDLSGVTSIEDANTTDVVTTTTETVNTVQRFHGVCVDGKVFALIAIGENGSETIRDTENSYLLKKAAVMSSSYRQDIKGCRNRFLELVNIKYRESNLASNQLVAVELLNFTFSFMPGYSGAENVSNGNKVVGLAEIAADIATLGVSSKFKAGWQTFNLSKRMFRSVQASSRIVVMGANMVRLGGIIRDVNERGISVQDIPTAVLLITETGFVAMRVKVTKAKLSSVKKGIAKAEAVVSQLVLNEVIEKLGNKVKRLEPGSLEAIFSSKSAMKISPDELLRIRQSSHNGESLSFDEIHKLISNTSVRMPDNLVNVTSSNTFLQIVNSDGKYFGYVGFPGLPKGIYGTAKPITWSQFDLLQTQGSSVQRDVMMVFVGDAAKDFGRLKPESGFFGHSTAIGKTTLKPLNPEFATKSGDVKFLDFDVHFDGTKSLVVVKKMEILDELHGFTPGSSEYKNLTRTRAGLFSLVVITDLNLGFTVLAAGAATSAGTIAVSDILSRSVVEWLMPAETFEK